MLDVLTETSHDKEDDSPEEGVEVAVAEEAQNSGSSRSKQVLKEGKTRYYDRRQ